MTLRFAVIVLAACMLASSAHAQRSFGAGGSMPSQSHGMGGSVTSFRPSAPTQFGGGSFVTHGIPPSVTSITPSDNSRFSGGFNFGRHGRHHGGRGQDFVPIYVPLYSYPYYSYDSGL